MKLKMTFQNAVNVKPLIRAVKKANKKALRASANEVKKEAKQIVSRKGRRGKAGRDQKGRFTKGAAAGRSKPGKPPFRVSGNLRKSIKAQVKTTVALVGSTQPSGAHGQILKWGRRPGARGGELKPRPFMQPALQNVRNRLPDKWKNRL